MNANEKVCVIAGCNSNIGRETCILMSQKGFSVAAIDLQDEKGEDIINEITNNGGKASFWHLDSTADGSLKKTFSEIYNTLGEINLVISTNYLEDNEGPFEDASSDKRKINIFEKLGDRIQSRDFLYPFMSKNSCNTLINICAT